MTEPRSNLPVVNASPFIVLALSGRLDLLRLDSTGIIIPRRVHDEVTDRSPPDAAAESMRTVPWIEVVEVGRAPAAVRAHRLDRGEEEVLTWALAHPGTLAVLDDRRGRRAAMILGVPFTGTLGLVLDAKRRGAIDAARPVIEDILRRTGWRLSPSLVEAALAEVGE